MPVVSVIIPNYHHARFLRQRIDTVLNQTFQDFEVIILDDCSTDNSREIIESYRGNEKISHIIYNEKNSGSPFKQWQKGIAVAEGEYVWIAESDDYCEENFLDILIKILINSPQIVIGYCQSIKVNKNNEIVNDLSFWYNEFNTGRWKTDYKNEGIKEITSFLIKKNTIPNASAVLFRKKNSSSVLDYISTFRLCGDWLFWIKLLQKGQIIYTIQTKNYYREHQTTVRNTINKNDTYKELKKLYQLLLNENIITHSQKKELLNDYRKKIHREEFYIKRLNKAVKKNARFLKRIKNYLRRRINLKREKRIRKLIGMTSLEEREFWKKYASDSFTGNGAIIDLGCWLGSTTMSLAEGLKKNHKVVKNKKIVNAFDRFVWEEWMDPYLKGSAFENKFRSGDNFKPAFDFFTRKYQKYIDVKKADLLIEKWGGGEIEFLLIDAMKTNELCNSIFRNFYPYLRPNVSVVLHQDFAHYFTYWIHLLQFSLKDYFEPIKSSNNAGSLAFNYVKQIPDSLFLKKIDIRNFSEEQLEKVFEYSLGLVKDNNRPQVLAAKMMAWYERFGRKKTISTLELLLNQYHNNYDLNKVKSIIFSNENSSD